MTRDEAIDAVAKALREHDMKGRITVDWDRVPNGQKKKWWAKSAVALDALKWVAPTVPPQPSRREDWHYDSQGYCDNPGRGY